MSTEDVRQQAVAIYEKALADGNVPQMFEQVLLELARKTAVTRAAGIIEDRRNPSNPSAEAMVEIAHQIFDGEFAKLRELIEARDGRLRADLKNAGLDMSDTGALRLKLTAAFNVPDTINKLAWRVLAGAMTALGTAVVTWLTIHLTGNNK